MLSKCAVLKTFFHSLNSSASLLSDIMLQILAADPKELERWCSIKRITQLKPSFKEKSDAMSFKKKAENEALKRKILPSLYKM